ncbi:MAG: hypothetical protein FJW40_04565, partial [Acidobacteria bacterium]|nr:hypothetical protein [Acidobacteriota bacterium]
MLQTPRRVAKVLVQPSCLNSDSTVDEKVGRAVSVGLESYRANIEVLQMAVNKFFTRIDVAPLVNVADRRGRGPAYVFVAFGESTVGRLFEEGRQPVA